MISRKTTIAVGLMVLIGVGIFVSGLGILARWKYGDTGYTMDIQFNFLNNLAEGSPVRISGGVPVGYVERIYQKDLKTYVRIYLNPELRNKLPKDEKTVFAIYTTGLMGQKYINISVPENAQATEYYQNGDVIRGVDPPSIDQMLLAFSSWFDGKNGGQVLAEIMEETQRFLSNLNGIVSENRRDIRLTIQNARSSFQNLSQQLEVLVAKLNILSGNFAEISTKNKNDIQVLLKNLSDISRNLNLVTQRINSGRGSVGRFIADEELYRNTYQTVVNARLLFERLKDDPSLLMYNKN